MKLFMGEDIDLILDVLKLEAALIGYPLGHKDMDMVKVIQERLKIAQTCKKS